MSPIIGAFFLTELDETCEKLGVFYTRFLDDILVLAQTRWQLRTAVKVVHRTLAGLHLEIQPTKTFIGKIDKGFDFLGYHLAPGRLSLAQSTLEAFVACAHQLYEQEPAGGAARLGVDARYA